MGSREFAAWQGYFGRGVTGASEPNAPAVDALALLDSNRGGG